MELLPFLAMSHQEFLCITCINEYIPIQTKHGEELGQCSNHSKINQLMCIVNQVNDFYMTVHCPYQSFAHITNKK